MKKEKNLIKERSLSLSSNSIVPYPEHTSPKKYILNLIVCPESKKFAIDFSQQRSEYERDTSTP